MTDPADSRTRTAGDPGSGPDDPPGPAPAVVVTVVAHDPGWWFEETLASIAAQDYPNISVLVVDTASADAAALRDRVAAVLPDAHLRRLDTDPGFAAAADEVLVAVQGAAFHLFCHDDVRLAPDAVRLLVEEAYRSNAGVVGPKVVQWADERRLLSVGMGSDRYGQPVHYVERGDLDQAQHDAVRDVFYVPGSATLVRADLFAALGGFDRSMTFHGEDLDLCWRAHVAGARVIVAPAARVAHLEALGVRRPVDDRRRLQQRHRLRAMRTSTTLGTRVRTTPLALLLAFMEIVQSVALGRLRHARDITSAWSWNARHAGSARRRRHDLAAIRQAPDGDVRSFQSRGSARFSAFVRAQLGRDDSGRRDFVSNIRTAKATTSVVVWGLIVVFLLLGSRELLFGRGDIPAVGDFQPFLGPGQMLSRWISGFQTVGLGSTAPAPTGFGIFGGLGVVFLGAVGVLRKVLILGLWPVGAIGMWRFTKPVGSRRARIVATVAYVIVPLPANAMAEARWGGLVAYATVPWVLGQLAAASRVAPFGDLGGSAGPGRALAAAAAPRGRRRCHHRPGRHHRAGHRPGRDRLRRRPRARRPARRPGRRRRTGAGRRRRRCPRRRGAAAALEPLGRRRLGGRGRGELHQRLRARPRRAAALRHRARSATACSAGRCSSPPRCPCSSVAAGASAGPCGAGSWPPAASAPPGSPARAGWSTSCPGPTCCSLRPRSGLALAAGLGMAAFEVDLPDYHFGWRQIVSLLAGAAFVLALLPALGTVLSGPLGPAPGRLRPHPLVPRHAHRRPDRPGALDRRRQRHPARRAGASTPPRSTTSGPIGCSPSPRRRPARPPSPRSGPAPWAPPPRPSRRCRWRHRAAPPASVRSSPRWR